MWILSRLKRTSPTAYCDCWEKCKCKTLIAGQKSARLDLLYRLLTATNLVTLPNSRQVGFQDTRGKCSALLSDIFPASRSCSVLQGRAPPAISGADSRTADSGTLPVQAASHQGGPESENSQSWGWVTLLGGTLMEGGCFLWSNSCFPADSDMPDHDLEPPRFAQLALERVLQDWNALKSMIMFGSQENKDPYVFIEIFHFFSPCIIERLQCILSFFLPSSLSASSRIGHLLPEEQVYLNQQSGTIRLDCFTHCLIVKCTADILVSLLSCIANIWKGSCSLASIIICFSIETPKCWYTLRNGMMGMI